MNAIIRHRGDGQHYLATIDENRDVTHLSAPLPVADDYGREWRSETVDWEQYGYADVEPFESTENSRLWACQGYTVVHTL